MFAVSQLDEDRVGPDDAEPPCPFTCVGRIAGHVELEDGTSHLVLEGLRRAKVLKVQRRTPYPRLEIAPLAEEDILDPLGCTREIARIMAYSERLIGELGEEAQPLLDRLRGLANQPGPLADAAAGHLVTDTAARRRLLECLSPMQRLTLVADQLARLEAERLLGENSRDLDRGMN
jgi:Lon protease-like protein